MFGKKLTFIIVPDTSETSRQIGIRTGHLYAAVAVVLVLLFASLFFASEYLGVQVERAELDRLRTENETLARQYEKLRWNLSETETRYDQLIQKEIALRQVFGLPEISSEERQLGIGGPEPLSLADWSASQKLAYTTEADVDRLLTVSRFELEKFAEVESGLEELSERLRHTPSIWPARGWLSRGCGMKIDPFTGYKRAHRGIDISNDKGTPIISPADGRVKSVATDRRMGKMIVVDHGYGFITRYGHLSKIEVKRGQQIKRGDVIAKMGSTGYSTGPHLHYEVWRNGKYLNPRDFILNEK